MRMIMILILMLATLAMGCAVQDATSTAEQHTGTCVLPEAQAGGGDSSVVPDCQLFQTTADFSSALAAEVGYLGPINVTCTSTACRTRLYTSATERYEVACSTTSCLWVLCEATDTDTWTCRRVS